MTRTFLDELAWRGLLFQSTEGAQRALAGTGIVGYCGFDPTGSSLHIGNLVPVMGLVHLQRTGHFPVALVGGGTGMIGDPSGKSAERNLLTLDQVAENAASIRQQLERFLDFDGAFAARLVNNADWLMELKLVDFLRDTGKHFGINAMMAKDSVKSRLETGISYTEFSYMLLQAYDFLELNRRAGVTLQLGGSDQWGNITAGTELIRKAGSGEAHGVTLPLVTNADGSKFGKTAAGTSVWLDPARTSPYKFYQYWINCDDRDVGRYLRMFTLLEREHVEALDALVLSAPEKREAQSALAADVTTRVHGAAATEAAREASRVIFDRKLDPRSLRRPVLEMLWDELPHVVVQGSDGAAISVVDVLVESGLVKSKGDARRQLQQGAVAVNGNKLSADEATVAQSDALEGGYFLVRKGGRDVALARLGPA
ncbi:MAG: tyrosine--tRNA ligase [Gemmatimonadetes bacterium]|jgi:tyrosyl-tRNA synthetase|nr:tyrosine--tRNA ligase [Gemmatimonadota bacterium]MBP9105551.1 tyrosine--tRNA ligase [Gemmatimonadaceae bacterium]MBK6458407.1 tyrosine--tRNA ligase [Gemmatimonadota bacterium]MBK6843547.1 tyrosine--tRNA ligase [Gemmatimonadota bacterium]MBK7833360.1 tyrosine--tRNA ligase [Gemmatimonadota bacterium]